MNTEQPNHLAEIRKLEIDLKRKSDLLSEVKVSVIKKKFE